MKWGDYDDEDDDVVVKNEDDAGSAASHSDTSSVGSTPRKEGLSLQYEWVLWFDDGAQIKGQSHTDYENSIKQLGSFSTIQDFWRYWNNLADPSKLAEYSNLRMFKKGIKPMWEDPANMDGGKWVVQCTKEQTSLYTQKVALAIIGEQLDFGDDICGLVLSVRPKSDTINIWNRTGNDTNLINVTTTQLSSVLENYPLRYQAHKESMNYSKSPRTPGRSSSEDVHAELFNPKPKVPALDLDSNTRKHAAASPRAAHASPLSKSGGYGSPKDHNNYNKDYNRDSHRDSYNRDRDRDRDRERGGDRDRDRDSYRDRDRERGGDRDRDSYSRDRDRGDRDRDRDRDRDGHSELHRSGGHYHNNYNNHSNYNNNNRDGYKDRDGHRDRDGYSNSNNNRDYHNGRDNHRDSNGKDNKTTSTSSTDDYSSTIDFAQLQEMARLDKSWADLEEDEELVKLEAKEKEAKEKEAREKEAKEREAREKEAKEAREREAKEAKEAREREAKEKEAREREVREKEAKEKEAREREAREREAKEAKEAKEREAKEAKEVKEVKEKDGKAWGSPAKAHPTRQHSQSGHSQSGHSQPAHSQSGHPQSSHSHQSQPQPPSPHSSQSHSRPHTPQKEQAQSANQKEQAQSQASSLPSSSGSVEVPPPPAVVASSMPHRHSGDLNVATHRLHRQEHKHHRKSRSVSVVEGQAELINSILSSQQQQRPETVPTESPSQVPRSSRRNSITLERPLLFDLPPLPSLPTQHLLSIIEPPLPTIPELSGPLHSLNSPALGESSGSSHRRHKKSASVSQIGSLQSLLASPSPAGIKIGFSHRSPSQEALNINAPTPRKKSPSYANVKDSGALPTSFSPPSSASSVSRRRSSLPPPLIPVSSPKRHTSTGRITPTHVYEQGPYVVVPPYPSPPSSSRGKTSSESDRRSHRRQSSQGQNDANKARVIDRPYFGDPDDDEDEEEDDVALRPDLSGLQPIPIENFIRPIPLARRPSRTEKPDKAFIERFSEAATTAARSSESDVSASSPRSDKSDKSLVERTSSPAGKRGKRSKRGSHHHAGGGLAQAPARGKWSLSDYLGVIVLAIFVAAITVLLQNSW